MSVTAIATVRTPQEVIPSLSQQDLREAQLADSNLAEILKAKEAGTDIPPPPLGHHKDRPWSREFEDEQGSSSALQLVVPSKYREQIVMELHAGAMGGHLAVDKMHSRLKERFYRPGHWKDVQLFCTSCATRKTRAPKHRAPLQPIHAGYPLELVAMDLTGPFPEGPCSNSYILVVGDYFIKWMEAYAVPDQEAITIAQKLVDEFFCRFSVPSRLHSDQ